DHSPVSVNCLNSVSEQPMRGDFDLRRVNLHDDRNWGGDEFDLNLSALRRARFRRLIPGERDRPVDGLVHRSMLKVENWRLRAIEHGLDDRVDAPDLASHAFEQLAFGIIRIAPSNQNVDGALYPRKWVLYFVRQAGGQFPETRGLLTAIDLAFVRHSLGD